MEEVRQGKYMIRSACLKAHPVCMLENDGPKRRQEAQGRGCAASVGGEGGSLVQGGGGKRKRAEEVRICRKERPQDLLIVSMQQEEERAGMLSPSLTFYCEPRTSSITCRSQHKMKMWGFLFKTEARGRDERGPCGWHTLQACEASPK